MHRRDPVEFYVYNLFLALGLTVVNADSVLTEN